MQSCGIVDGWTGIRVIGLGARDESVGRAVGISAIRSIGAVDAYSAFSLANSPLDGIEHQAKDEEEKGSWKVNVKQFFLFLCKFCFHRVCVLDHRWVVIVGIAGLQGGCGAEKDTFERYSFSTDAETAFHIHRWEIRGRGPNADCLQSREGLGPVAVTISVFAPEPADKISIVEVKPKESNCIEQGPRYRKFMWIPRRGALEAEWRQ
jgi:hypothetical protein